MRLTIRSFATLLAVGCLAFNGDFADAQILKPLRKPAPAQPQVQQPAPVQVQPGQEAQPVQRERQPQVQREQRTGVREQGGSDVRRASFVMKSRVMLSGDAAAGQVVDFILNDHGCIDYVVIDYQEKFLLVPYSVVDVDFHRHVIRLDITQERFRQIPTFTEREWSTVTEARFRNRVDTFFGVSTQREGADRDRTRPGTRPSERDTDADRTPRSKDRDAERSKDRDADRPSSDKDRPRQSEPAPKDRPRETDQPDRKPREQSDQPDRTPRPKSDQPERNPRPQADQPERTPRQEKDRERPRDDNPSQGSGNRRQQDQ
jgi:hypothetical protein